MPRPRKPARLYQRPDTGEWVIRDGDKTIRTGCGAGERGAAESQLADYIAARMPERRGPAQPSQITVGEVLARYVDFRGPMVADPARLGRAVRALAAWWGDQTADAVKGTTCRAYAVHRGSTPGAAKARVELGILQAALNHAHAEAILVHPIKVTLPPANAPQDRWLTRPEVARLLRASPPHLRRFILIAVYTGTRSAAILALRWGPSLKTGWVDLAGGKLHRSGALEAQTNKRRGTVPMPRQLAAHMRRWSRAGGSHVVQWGGKPITRIRKVFALACARAGIHDATPHDLKRTAITWAAQRGMPIDDAAGYFDTTAAMIDAVYRVHSPDHMRRAREAMERRE